MLKLPEGWQKVKLEDLIETIETGKRPKGGGRNYLENGIPSIEAGNLNSFGGFDFHNVKFIPSDYFENLSQGKIKVNDILIVKDGATTGKVSFVNEDFPFKQAAINEHLFIIRVNKEKIIPKFLFYYLYSQEGQIQIRNYFVGSAQGGINRNFIKKVFVPFPVSLKEQKRIVAKLNEIFSKLEKARKLREEALKEAEKIMQAALNQVFSKAEEKGWEIEKLENIATIIMGQSPPSDTYNERGEGLPFFQGKADFGIIYPTPTKWCVSPLKIVNENNILISVRAPVGSVNICKEKSCIGRGLAAIKTNENILFYKFLFYYLKFLEPQMPKIGKGSTFGAIGKDDLKKIKIPLPPLEEQKQIAEYFDSLQQKIIQLEKRQEETQKEIEILKNSILNKALRGEL